MQKIIFILTLFVFVACTPKSNTQKINSQIIDVERFSTGNWQLGNFVDGFGDPTGKTYPYIKGNGTISVYLTEKRQNVLCLAFNSISKPYDKEPYFWLKYKTTDGYISDWLKLSASYGNGYAILGEGTEDLVNRIRNGEFLKFQGFSADNPNSVAIKGIKDTNFSFDFNGYDKIMQQVEWNGTSYNPEDYK